MRLHRQYGPGLSDIGPNGNQVLFGGMRAQPASSGDSSVEITVNTDQTWTINGIVINTTDWRAAPLGIVAGLQYNNNTWGQCFITTIEVVKFQDYFQQDWDSLINYGDYYSLLVYQPIRLVSVLLVAYDKCNGGTILDQAAQIANLDTSFVSETIARQGVTLFTKGPAYLTDLQNNCGITDPDVVNYYYCGWTLGNLMKILGDITINN
jgi:hypothetical protein